MKFCLQTFKSIPHVFFSNMFRKNRVKLNICWYAFSQVKQVNSILSLVYYKLMGNIMINIFVFIVINLQLLYTFQIRSLIKHGLVQDQIYRSMSMARSFDKCSKSDPLINIQVHQISWPIFNARYLGYCTNPCIWQMEVT